jgi:cytidyltransferase-like protein
VKKVLVLGSFDDLKDRQMRFLQEAARLGSVHVLLLSDKTAESLEGRAPKFPQAEREYFVGAIRYAGDLTVVDGPLEPDKLPRDYAASGGVWAVDESGDAIAKRSFCEKNGLEYQVIKNEQLEGYPEPTEGKPDTATKRPTVLVTGCYDWFHSGHVRFFEEVAELGDLHVVVGHDANIRLLKGEGHPMYSEQQRRYMASSIRFVKRAHISSGDGWLDAEPEIERIKPDIYAVNEDGDKPEKDEYCQAHGIEYRVLKRTPKEGLPRRQSTDLRGF